MKLLFSFVFLLFLSFHTQAQVLIEHEIAQDMNQFNWSAFSNKANTKKYIDFRNQIFNLLGAKINTINGLKWNKLDLAQIEQELGLYKIGAKTGLSAEMIQAAEEAISLHWGNMNSIESQIKARAGLAGGLAEFAPMTPMVGKREDYYNWVWELHKRDHEIVFNMVEKKDKALYKALGSNDEVYAGFITPYVERYMKKMGETAGAYYDSFKSPDADVDVKVNDAYNLLNMYLNSVEIYKCFIKNFKDPVGEKQKMLMGSIYNWHTNQALLGMNSIIEGYKTYGVETRPNAVAYSFFKFYNAPRRVKEKIGVFLRNDMLNKEEFIKADDRQRLGARVNALIGLNYLGVATPEERELYNKAHPNHYRELLLP